MARRIKRAKRLGSCLEGENGQKPLRFYSRDKILSRYGYKNQTRRWTGTRWLLEAGCTDFLYELEAFLA